MILTTGSNQWEGGLDVVVEGEAVQVTDEGLLQAPRRGVGDEVGRTLALEVHDRAFRHEGSTEAVLVFSIAPTRIFAFAKGTFGQTRHQF